LLLLSLARLFLGHCLLVWWPLLLLLLYANSLLLLRGQLSMLQLQPAFLLVSLGCCCCAAHVKPGREAGKVLDSWCGCCHC
jgi:hypothetical protein